MAFPFAAASAACCRRHSRASCSGPAVVFSDLLWPGLGLGMTSRGGEASVRLSRVLRRRGVARAISVRERKVTPYSSQRPVWVPGQAQFSVQPISIAADRPTREVLGS